MPKFAHYNPNANPSPVYGWYDTDTGVLPHLPDDAYLLPLTEAQWAARNSQPWQVDSLHLVPVPAVPLGQVKQAKKAELHAAYFNANSADVAYMSTTFQADALSQMTVQQSLLGYFISGTVPSGFYWIDTNNVQVSMTLLQFRGLLAAMLATQWTNRQHLQSLKTQVIAASSAAAVQAIVW